MNKFRKRTLFLVFVTISAILKICFSVFIVMAADMGLVDTTHLTDVIDTFINYTCLVLIPTGAVATNYLIQDYKRMQLYTIEKLKAIERSALVAVFTPEGVVRDLNDNMAQFFGFQKFEVIGQHHSYLCPSEFAKSLKYKQLWSQLSKGEYIVGTFRRVSKYGEEKWLIGSYNPIYDSHHNVIEIMKIATDVTEDFKLRREIQNKNTYLEHAAKILRHDMHSGINTYIPRGLRSLKRRLTEDQIKELKLEAPIKLIEEGLCHTQKVYKGVKEFTNLVKPNSVLETEIVNIGESLQEYLRSTAYKDQVALDRLPMLKVNEPLFCTAIDNMIRNGLKYNDSDFKLVAITMIDDEHLAVIDNGRGMTQKQFEKYCKPYLRQDGQKEKGSGLGLNIAVAILKEHGFSISCRHNPNMDQGTTIRIKVR
jgi:PAS domain S-box-containing protein